jgi:hypothetical protein
MAIEQPEMLNRDDDLDAEPFDWGENEDDGGESPPGSKEGNPWGVISDNGLLSSLGGSV